MNKISIGTLKECISLLRDQKSHLETIIKEISDDKMYKEELLIVKKSLIELNNMEVNFEIEKPTESMKKCNRSKSITIRHTCNDNEDEILKKMQDLRNNGYRLREMYQENDAIVYRFLENKRR